MGPASQSNDQANRSGAIFRATRAMLVNVPAADA